MSENIDGIQKDLEQRSTEELISILRNRDGNEWRPEAFAVVALVLKSRGVSVGEVVAMGAEPVAIDVVESEPTVTIANFFNPVEAHGSRMALEEAGIPAWVADEASGTMYAAGVGARLQVRRNDVDAAREVLALAAVPSGAVPPELAEPPCPACGSRNIGLEAWVERSGAEEGRRPAGRKWHHVCADCSEAWPA